MRAEVRIINPLANYEVKPTSCDNCYYFSSNSMVWPSGKCGDRDVSIRNTCDDFITRKDGRMREHLRCMKEIFGTKNQEE